MSDTIRALLKDRQQGGLPDAKSLFARAAEESQRSPIPLDERMIEDLYKAMFGPTMASQIVDAYQGYQQDSNLLALVGGKQPNQNPMVKTVTQLDR